MKSQLVGVLACLLATCVGGAFGVQGGVPARLGEFPYVVAVTRFHKWGHRGTCGGTIIDEKFVLTAASCVADHVERFDNGTYGSDFPSELDFWYYVFANTTDYKEDLNNTMFEKVMGANHIAPSATVRRVVKAYFLPEVLENGIDDIAILELESPLNLNDGYHQKIKLSSDPAISYEGAQAVLAGFGEHFGPENILGARPVFDGTLKKAHFRVVPFSRCDSSWATATGSELVHEINGLCLIAVTEDNEHPDQELGACLGDRGAPFVHEDTVIGFYSRSLGCDSRDKFPAVAVKVANYVDFINNVIGDRRPDYNQSIVELEFRV